MTEHYSVVYAGEKQAAQTAIVDMVEHGSERRNSLRGEEKGKIGRRRTAPIPNPPSDSMAVPIGFEPMNGGLADLWGTGDTGELAAISETWMCRGVSSRCVSLHTKGNDWGGGTMSDKRSRVVDVMSPASCERCRATVRLGRNVVLLHLLAPHGTGKHGQREHQRSSCAQHALAVVGVRRCPHIIPQLEMRVQPRAGHRTLDGRLPVTCYTGRLQLASAGLQYSERKSLPRNQIAVML